MAVEWYRAYHGAATDPKWIAIAQRAGTAPGVVASVWWALMDHASQHMDRGSIAGFDPEAIAAFYGWDEEVVERVLDALDAKGLIEDGRLGAWDRRQPKREDDSTERVRRYRQTKGSATRGNAVKRNVTQGNAVKRDVTLDESRVEKKREQQKESAPNGASSDSAAPNADRDVLVDSMWQVWTQELGGDPPHPKLSTGKRRTCLRLLLAEQLRREPDPVEAFRAVCQVVKQSDHHMSKRQYQLPESLFRSPERREFWCLEAKNPSSGPDPPGGFYDLPPELDPNNLEAFSTGWGE